MLVFATILSDEDKNWKKFWKAIIERNKPVYNGNDVIEIYKEISGLDDDEAAEELLEYFLHLYQDVRDLDKDVKTYSIKREQVKVFNKEVTYYDLKKEIIGLKCSSKNCSIIIQYCESMWTENIFDNDFSITIEFSSVKV